MNVQKLVIQGRIAEAIKLIPDMNGQILISSRHERNEKDKRIGVVSDEKYTLERNKIIASILDYCGVESSENNSIVVISPSIKQNSLSKEIAEYYKKYKRTEFVSEIHDLLKDVEKYESQKRISDSYDRRGRELKILTNDFHELVSKINLANEDSEDAIIAKVEKLLNKATQTAVSSAIDKLCLLRPNSYTLKGLKERLVEYGSVRSHRIKIIQELDDFLESL